MDDQQAAALATDTWTKCLALLPKNLAANLNIHSSDPKRLRKKGTLDIMRVRILPVQKAPVSFWSSAWCFYQIGIGTYDGSALCLGGVDFVQFSGQKVCGAGHWFKPVKDILAKLEAARPNVFSVDPRTDIQCAIIGARYRAKPHKYFPVDLAAADLAWLIKQSLPRFEALQ